MLAMTANFSPVKEPKNGHIGFASITVANGIRINGISVFEKDGKRNIAFNTFTMGDKELSYVVPKSKEAAAAMLDVVSQAVDNKGHFAIAKGDYKINYEVRGKKVNEPYADGRFAVDLSDLCTLHGITTRVVEYKKDTKDTRFTAVEMPRVLNAEGKVSMYTDKDGNEHANLQFEALVNKWKDKDGNDKEHDHSRDLYFAVMGKRKELNQPSLDDQINGAKAQADSAEKTADAPVKDMEAR